MKEIKRMRVHLPRNPYKGITISINSHHKCRGKWKINGWYNFYKRFPHTEKTIKEVG